MVKDFYEDYKRIKADREENNRNILVMDSQGTYTKPTIIFFFYKYIYF